MRSSLVAKLICILISIQVQAAPNNFNNANKVPDSADKMPDTTEKMPDNEQKQQIYKYVAGNGFITTDETVEFLDVKNTEGR